ncbi:MAG TPA: hypothetical protein VFL97_05130 [Nitrococcus sp.]|nr:hypothetical protein [Nitrococcus sp.]
MSEQEQGYSAYQAELEAIAAEDSAANDGEYIGAEEKSGPDQGEVELVASLAKMTGEILAARRGDHWRLADREALAWAEAAVPVINKYAPDFQSSPELALVLASAMLVLPRMQQDRSVAVARAKQKEEVAQNAGTSRHEPAELP